jgi:hypothetical protein
MRQEKPEGFELSRSKGAILEKNKVLRRMWDRVLDHMEQNGSSGSDKKP